MDADNPLYLALTTEHASKVIRIHAIKLSRSRGFSRGEVGDLTSEIRLRMLGRILDYDPEVAALNTYIDRLAGWAAGEITKHRLRQKRDFGKRPLSLDAPAYGGALDGVTLGGAVEDGGDRRRSRALGHGGVQCDLTDKLRRIISVAPQQDAAVAGAVMRTGSVLGASEELGISRRQVRKTLLRLRAMLEPDGGKEI